MKKRNNKLLLVIAGPTASGKTSLAISLARYFQTEIISADSRQFYKELPIGTAAPDTDQLQLVRHHFVGHLSVQDSYNVYRYEQDVLKLLEQLFQENDIVILTGGSGLYLDGVCHGIDELPDPDLQLRHELETLFKKNGLEALQQKLKVLDPEYFKIVDQQNSKRLMRAIEVCLQTGKTYTELRLNKEKARPFSILKLGLDVPREILNQRINRRTDSMIAAAWLEEAKSVFPLRHMNALNTVGYKELFTYFAGERSLEEAIEKIKTNTRRYAKRQMTWFRKDKMVNWIDPENPEEVIAFIERQRS